MTDIVRPIAPSFGGSERPRPSLPPPHRARPARLRRLDAALERLWRAGLAIRPPLEPAALMARVPGAAEVPDRSGWHRRLDLLCEDLADAHLTPLGRTLAYGQITAALGHRVRAEALWADVPEILARPVRAPVVIVGQMRSGSTRVHRLLAADPRLAATRFFESWNPVPRWGARLPLDDRAWRSRIALGASRLLNPGFQAIHPTRWHAPDEEIGWHAISLFGASFEAQWHLPRFTAHGEESDAEPVYREFRRFLQTVAHLRGGDERRWVMKVPQFTQDLPAILRVFPDATVVRLHRDPVAVVASSASLVRNQMAVQSERPCMAAIGAEALRKVALRHHRTEAALADATVPVAHVDFAAVTRDWENEMARVYAVLGLPFTPEARARMADYLATSRHRPEAHRYALADYGLSAEQVRAAVGED